MTRKQRKRFHKIHIEISNICNLQCSFCPPVERDNKMMSLDLFRDLVKQIAPMTELVCLHLMGDPLVHPKLKEMIDICDEYDLNIFLVTNGVLLKPEKFELLLHPRFYQINFSLHSFFDNFPDKNPEKYLTRIFNFTRLALEKRPELYLNYRLWNLNDPMGSQTQNTQMLAQICEQFNFEPPSEIDVRKKKSIKIQDRLYLHFDTEFIWPSLDLPMLGTKGTCYGLSSHFGILADGTVVPCCLDKEAAIPIGNATQQPIKEILASSRAQAILRGFKNKELVEKLCQRCQYIERFSDSRIPIKVA
ncbi:radical SAM/SPASM domain-containing protein [Kangiella sp. HZ709]|uniref:radical SAM/SPASM domain-containing protein n=1 Tax=Kangiella sp. HZ709 TaxID=2666328 RepID=UPI001D0DB729|nr:radical SAM/SPASM domain-containing protein [Kangiella sp. HZ709]